MDFRRDLLNQYMSVMGHHDLGKQMIAIAIDQQHYLNETLCTTAGAAYLLYSVREFTELAGLAGAGLGRGSPQVQSAQVGAVGRQGWPSISGLGWG